MRVVKPTGEREVPRGVLGGAEISQATAGASNIYMGVFRVPPGARSRPHYHANCESAVYILSGRLEVRWGDRLEQVVSLEPRDLVYVPPREAAGGIFFLCSPWSNYVHGQVLNVTGGQFTGMTT